MGSYANSISIHNMQSQQPSLHDLIASLGLLYSNDDDQSNNPIKMIEMGSVNNLSSFHIRYKNTDSGKI